MARFKVIRQRRRSYKLWRGTRDISRVKSGRKLGYIFRSRLH